MRTKVRAVRVPSSVIDDTRLLPPERATLLTLYSRVNSRGIVPMRAIDLSAATGQSLGTVNRHIRSLIEHDWVSKITVGDGKSGQAYQMTITPTGDWYASA